MIIAVVYWLGQSSAFFQKELAAYREAIICFAAALTLFVQYLQPAINMVNKAWKRLQSLNMTVNALKVKATEKFAAEKMRMTDLLAKATEESLDIQKKVALLSAEQKKLQSDIDDISSGRKIIHFIESRVTDTRYINSLGIISWVRKDFEQLDYLLRQQKQAQKVLEETTTETSFELERIILYIDDLDRCHESIVVKVLEAIHLLLAFPLFVVVVGVDPRWMHNALNLQYSSLLSAKRQVQGSPDGAFSSGEESRATSYDYLEKIFQIPFSLKPMTNKGRQDLVDAQLTTAATLSTAQTGDQQTTLLEADVPVPANAPVEEAEKEQQPSKPQEERKVPNGVKMSTTDALTTMKLEKLLITAEEKDFMKALSFFIGDSPRTIKRYINIYRIIRAHSQFQIRGGEMEHYAAAMFLLAVITGSPELTRSIVNTLMKTDDKSIFPDFLKSYKASTKTEHHLLDELLSKLEADAGALGVLDRITVDILKRNLELVCRFSFRSI